MELIYGTYNPSKLTSMKNMLKDLPFSIIDLSYLNLELLEAEENGNDPLENAVQKAMTYYKQIKKPIFSCDSGLFFEGVEEVDQPGVFIKRIHGNNLSYKEMLYYYRALAEKYGGKLTAYYKNAICLIIDEKHIYKYAGDDLNYDRFYLVDKPHTTYREGFPLDSLSVEIKSMKYYYDLEGMDEENQTVKQGFRNFFLRSLEDYQTSI